METFINVCNGDKIAVNVLIIDILCESLNFRDMFFSRHLVFASLKFREITCRENSMQ